MTVGIFPIRAKLLRPARDGAILACVALAVAHMFGLTQTGVDAHTYWSSDPLHPYSATAPAAADAYFYSPALPRSCGRSTRSRGSGSSRAGPCSSSRRSCGRPGSGRPLF